MGNGQKTALFTPRVTRFGTVSKAMWKQPPPTFDNPIEEVREKEPDSPLSPLF